ncbi:MAG: hypothetical protein IT282_14685 [Bacteroidetes bacterium]|nr:hypothetical protein [Bacteroidota bacterium]
MSIRICTCGIVVWWNRGIVIVVASTAPVFLPCALGRQLAACGGNVFSGTAADHDGEVCAPEFLHELRQPG